MKENFLSPCPGCKSVREGEREGDFPPGIGFGMGWMGLWGTALLSARPTQFFCPLLPLALGWEVTGTGRCGEEGCLSPGWAPKGPMQLLVAFFPGTQGGSQRKAGNGVLVGWLGPKGYGMEGAAGSVACCGAAAFPRLAFFSAVPPVPTGTRLGLPLIHRNTEVGALGLPPGCQQHPGLIAGTRDTPSIPGDQAGRGAQPPNHQAEGWGGSERGLPVFPEPFFFFFP